MRVLNGCRSIIEYSAPAGVRAMADALGRAEDVAFSPDDRRLAVAGFRRGRIAVFDIAVTASEDRAHVALTAGIELSSPMLKLPHGVAFIDAETLVVADRERGVAVLAAPPGTADGASVEATPIQAVPANRTGPESIMGSVHVAGGVGDPRDVLICDNARHHIVRHHVDCRGGYALGGSEVLLEKWLDVPDGLTVSPDQRWLAVSNHGVHSVMLYEHDAAPHADSDPVGLLRGVRYPHGLRFSADGRRLFVADAGAPYIHLYAAGRDGWHGVHTPLAHIRIMDDELFARGHRNPSEGGPKGLALDAGQRVLAVASEERPLAFFDVRGALAGLDAEAGEASWREHRALEMAYEMHILEMNRAAVEKLRYMRGSRSWRITKPLRDLDSVLRRR